MVLWEDTEALRKALWHVRESTESDFYRKKYAELPKNQETVLETIPLLTRDELVATPPGERCFVPPHEVAFIGYTSGTTSGQPLVSYFAAVDNYFFEPSLEIGVTRPLITYPPLNKNFSASFVQQCREAQHPVTPVFADYQHLPNSAVIAAATTCDALYATPTIALALAEHIERFYDPQAFKLLALSSETLSDAIRAELQKRYPSAAIANLYASSEIGQFILFPCPYLIEHGLNEFHFIPEALLALELIDDELVVSYGLNKAFPLLRYKTGDFFSLASEGCPCGHPGPTLSWLGRPGVDRLRVRGFELFAADVEKVLADVAPALKEYQLHFYEGSGGEAAPVLEFIPPEGSDPGIMSDVLAHELAVQLLITPELSFAQAAEQGNFAPLMARPVKTLSAQTQKTKRLINHLSS